MDEKQEIERRALILTEEEHIALTNEPFDHYSLDLRMKLRKKSWFKLPVMGLSGHYLTLQEPTCPKCHILMGTIGKDEYACSTCGTLLDADPTNAKPRGWQGMIQRLSDHGGQGYWGPAGAWRDAEDIVKAYREATVKANAGDVRAQAIKEFIEWLDHDIFTEAMDIEDMGVAGGEHKDPTEVLWGAINGIRVPEPPKWEPPTEEEWRRYAKAMNIPGEPVASGAAPLERTMPQVVSPVPVTRRKLDDGDYIVLKIGNTNYYHDLPRAKRIATDIMEALDEPVIPNHLSLPLLERLQVDWPPEGTWAHKRDGAIVMAMMKLSYRDMVGAHRELSRAAYFDGRSVEAGEEKP